MKLIEEKIYIVIPVYNRKYFTYHCLISLRDQSIKNFKIIIIDDGSKDGTGEMLEKDFPEMIVLKGDGNLWWTAATNLGVKYALAQGADYVMTLNNDTILYPDCIEKMLYWTELKPKALLGAFFVHSETEEPLFGGGILNWKTGNVIYHLDNISHDKLSGIHPVNYFPGRGLLIPVEVFKKIGFYDEDNFPQTTADYDFTHRAIKAGFEIFCNYDAKIKMFPDESGDSQLRNNKSFKNYFLHLFGIKGGGNIIVFVKYTVKNCPIKYLPFFLLIGLARRIGGYLLEWLLELIRKEQQERE